jgi:lipopolysaccharide/colanic/teichoic acid biosynthesis glycosyltransferase
LSISPPLGLTKRQRAVKRAFDISGALLGLVLVALPAIAIAVWIKLTSLGPIFFIQARVGRNGELFGCVKFRTMAPGSEAQGTVTTAADTRVTPVGRFLRRNKLDEIPQLWNVLSGHMSFVGPRPDVPGFADKLQGDDRLLLSVRPGLTGPASLVFRNEEALLAEQQDPETYNRAVIFPEKVRINLKYINNYSLWGDFVCVLHTIFPE